MRRKSQAEDGEFRGPGAGRRWWLQGGERWWGLEVTEPAVEWRVGR